MQVGDHGRASASDKQLAMRATRLSKLREGSLQWRGRLGTQTDGKGVRAWSALTMLHRDTEELGVLGETELDELAEA